MSKETFSAIRPTMQDRFLRALILYLVLTVLFGVLERYFASIPDQPRFRRGYWLDSFYWFLTPMVIQILSMGAIALVLLPVYLLLGRSLDWQSVLTGYGWAAQLPLWVQGLIMIVVGDGIGYWTHRLQHERPLPNLNGLQGAMASATGHTACNTPNRCGTITPSTTARKQWTG